MNLGVRVPLPCRPRLIEGGRERRPVERRTAGPLLRAPDAFRSITVCQVGERGFWTFPSNDFLIDYFWHYSSTIERIERVERQP
jgi:hypothetical protein